MINIIFFSKYRESFGASALSLPSANLGTIGDLMVRLKQDYPGTATIFADPRILVAINQQLADIGSTVADGDEVAFFPPVTGG